MQIVERFRGVIPAVVTPFSPDASAVDASAYQTMLEWLIAEGVHGLVPVGTTGESPTLTHAEHRQVVEMCLEVARGRVPVIAGSGSNTTREAIELTEFAEKAGADAVLVVTPYYNKPNQEGLFQHFKCVAQSTSLPLIVYNNPARCVIDLLPETLARLVESCPNIVGIKDATGDMVRISKQRRLLGPDFLQLSGDDLSTLGFMAHGGHGMISVTANVGARFCIEFYESCFTGDFETARTLHDKLLPLHQSLFLDPNPGGVKYALSLLGRISPTLRLPLVPVSSNTQGALQKALQCVGLLPSS